jgi:tetratricopeptide (TPR) repeat protein
MRYSIKICSLALSLLIVVSNSFAQPGTTVDLKKPTQYENRELRSEKTSEKKLSIPKRILQNTFTHYNYYFNANNKLNQVVDRAKASYQDDYTTLLPFYSYTLEGTAQQKNDIDSVIYKCTAGILLHDLRSDWIDNLYLLLGKAYMFRKDFDSATHTFQYINYAYAPKDEGYDIPIGSNSSNTNGVFTIATKESKNLLKKIVTHPESRNESFIWQARNFVEQGELSDAAGLIEILRNDPNFPKRLKTELHEVISYWFYHQNAYDSAAFNLTLALDEADGRKDKARWEYLIAQLYSLAGKNDLAVKYYNRAINHTVDPVMEVYARLNSLRINNSGQKESYIQDNLDDLLKMARKDKYENYRDIIYYTAAKVEMERNNTAGAIKWLKKSIETSNNNPKQKAESFLMLADLSYDTKAYVASSDAYDSTLVNDLRLEADKARVNERRAALKTISTNISKITEQDSLQRIANLPAAEREAFIRRLVKQLRKSKGLKDEPSSGGNSGSSSNSSNTDIYADNKAEWYFSNPGLKAKGYSEFKSRWGNRPNIDNWRRQQAIDRSAGKTPTGTPTTTNTNNTDSSTEINYESLLANLPLTEEQIASSNMIIQTALSENGKTFHEQLEDYISAIETFEELLRRFSNPLQKEEALFALIYLYSKTNNVAKATAAKQQLLTEFPNGSFSQIIKESSGNTGVPGKKSDAATKKYEEIYNLFLSGKFEKAVEEKRNADATYGNSFWTPQLLFIESIYYIKQKQDSIAINRLTAITTTFATSPLAEKAKTMIDVLSRRKQIEDYLTKLDVERKDDDRVERVVMTEPDKQTTTKPVEIKETITSKPVAIENKTIKIDSLATKPAFTTSTSKFSFAPGDAHYTAIILDQVDGMYVNEVKNAFNKYNLEKFYRQVIKISTQALDERYTMVLLGPFKNAGEAVDYIDKTRPAAAGNILPWLGTDKYSFLIINNTNLELLKESKDLSGYKKLLTETLPGKF